MTERDVGVGVLAAALAVIVLVLGQLMLKQTYESGWLDGRQELRRLCHETAGMHPLCHWGTNPEDPEEPDGP